MLLPCGVGLFTGVEFVCCPPEHVAMETTNKKLDTKLDNYEDYQDNEEEDEEDEDEEEDDDYYFDEGEGFHGDFLMFPWGVFLISMAI